MSKKRKDFQPGRARHHKRSGRTVTASASRENLENSILRIVYLAEKPLTSAGICEQLPVKNRNAGEGKKAIEGLVRNRLLTKSGRNRFLLSNSAPICSGTLTQHAKGFGFVAVSGKPEKMATLSRDPFIPPSKMAGALHGDEVLIRIASVSRNNRPEAAVIGILDQGSDTLCGIVRVKGRDLRVYPDDHRFPFLVQLVADAKTPVKDGDGVKVRFQRTAATERMLPGQVMEILGSPESVDTQMRFVIEKFNLPDHFSTQAIDETRGLKPTVAESKGRRDLRGINHITIDGESAKDFDDAISVVRKNSGFRLYVSIADVSHFVPVGSELDREAFARGSSVYFPGRVIPMLPETLSNDLCSLVPGEDRLTLTAVLDFDHSGKLQKKDFCRSIIHSKHRFTYTTVREILIDKDETACREHQEFTAQLQVAGELAGLLRKNRFARGSIDFNLFEPQFSLTDDGEVAEITRAERNFAHKLIEEFMLAANEAVATFLGQKIPTVLYRIHEPPDEEKLKEFQLFAKTLSITMPPFDSHPTWFSGLLNKVKKSRYEYIVNNLLLRSLSQARYSTSETGHFGLASPSYTHFTSPIRRYPDLLIHRLLIGVLEGRKEGGMRAGELAPLAIKEAGEYLSKRERIAVDAERDMNDRLKISYMKDKIGEPFSATISGVTEDILFIEIEDLCISGGIPVEFLDDDYYIHDAKNFRLFGEITATTYQIGDSIQVRLASVNQQSKRLTFTPEKKQGS